MSLHREQLLERLADQHRRGANIDFKLLWDSGAGRWKVLGCAYAGASVTPFAKVVLGATDTRQAGDQLLVLIRTEYQGIAALGQAARGDGAVPPSGAVARECIHVLD